jgi:hypothetical protein
MARIFFITGKMDDKHEIGMSSHKIIDIPTNNYPTGIQDTLNFIKERMENDDFLSITITRDCHTKREGLT